MVGFDSKQELGPTVRFIQPLFAVYQFRSFLLKSCRIYLRHNVAKLFFLKC